jgi:hypothetical protein
LEYVTWHSTGVTGGPVVPGGVPETPATSMELVAIDRLPAASRART